MEKYHTCKDVLRWYGLYNGNGKYSEYFSPETNAHPAKMSFLLAEKIVKHLEQLGLIHKGDRIIDFMAGTGRTGIVAELNGYKFTGIELEPHFIDMIEANREVLKKKMMRDPDWNIIQGDARKLSELLGEHGAGITSPVYGDMDLRYGKNGIVIDGKKYDRPCMHGSNEGYGCSEGQIGDLKDAGIISPPYENQRAYRATYDPAKWGRVVNGRKLFNQETGESSKYGDSKGQIGNERRQTYLGAMLKVYSEAYKAGISPLVVVTKNPTRNHKLRRLDIDTARLLEMVGYRIVDYHQAVLFTKRRQKTLLGEEKVDVKGRMSFFKLLSIRNGNVAADHEDVIIAVKG